jgi:crotonobetainyl-CoA:carnitine CoA-transferase CaiB-like acyl-CoA transferase
MFADLGADVIKVESMQRIDGWRASGGRNLGERTWERSSAHNFINVNKRGITLNLRTPEGQALCRQLVAIADVLIENYSPRVMGQFGMDYPALRDLNPRLVMVSLSGFGATGPWRDYVSYALTIEAMSGLVGLTGYPDGPPMQQIAAIPDPLGGLSGGAAGLMAYYRARRTGVGCHVDLSQAESVSALLGDQLLHYGVNGRLPPRLGNASASAAPHGVYPCQGDDQWVALAVHTDAQWQALCTLIGAEDLANDHLLAGRDGRQAHIDRIDARIAAWTSARTKREAMDALTAAGVPAGAVQDNVETLSDPQLQARGHWQWLDRDVVGRHPHPGMGLRLDCEPPTLSRPAPTLGQHNHEVLTELLGLSLADIEHLAEQQIIGWAPLE